MHAMKKTKNKQKTKHKNNQKQTNYSYIAQRKNEDIIKGIVQSKFCHLLSIFYFNLLIFQIIPNLFIFIDKLFFFFTGKSREIGS